RRWLRPRQRLPGLRRGPAGALRVRESRESGSWRVPGIALASGRRPFLDAREMVVVRETGYEFGERTRQVGRILAGERIEQDLKSGEMLLGELEDVLGLSAGVFFFAARRAAKLEINRLLGFERRQPLKSAPLQHRCFQGQLRRETGL